MNRVVYFDLETGGLDPKLHPVIQFAAVAVEDWKEIESLEIKIHFDPARCEPRALEMNSFDFEIWKAEAFAPKDAVEAIDMFFRRHAALEMVSKRGTPWKACQLAGFNAATFDRPFLGELFRRERAFCVGSLQVLDVLQLAMWWRELLPAEERPKNLKLATVAERMGIRFEAHDALEDVRATAQVAKHLLAELTPKRGLR